MDKKIAPKFITKLVTELAKIDQVSSIEIDAVDGIIRIVFDRNNFHKPRDLGANLELQSLKAALRKQPLHPVTKPIPVPLSDPLKFTAHPADNSKPEHQYFFYVNGSKYFHDKPFITGAELRQLFLNQNVFCIDTDIPVENQEFILDIPSCKPNFYTSDPKPTVEIDNDIPF